MSERDRSALGPSRSEDDRAFRLRRSILITPGDSESKVRKAAASAADVCLIEWEDGVHETQKQSAREVTAGVFADTDWQHRERVVRVNSADTEFFRDDVAAAVRAGADGIMLPKVYVADDVRGASKVVAAAEAAAGLPPGSVLLWAMIETAQALVNVAAIASSDERLTAIMFGGGDLGADLKLKRVSLGANRLLGPIRYEYLYGYGATVAAARAAKIDPVNMGYTTYEDLEGTRRDAEFSAQFGFSGGLGLSVRQLPTINEAFSPSPSDIEWATDVMKDFDDAGADDRTVLVVDREMTDGPYVRSAMQILRLRDALAKRSGGPA
jgi:citrate lyase beta subunit